MNSPRLQPYHNPENVDESRVPAGWRFLYADEAGKKQQKPCRVWLPKECYPSECFDPRSTRWTGQELEYTYIVPVNA